MLSEHNHSKQQEVSGFRVIILRNNYFLCIELLLTLLGKQLGQNSYNSTLRCI
jgi:hypothetical protein